MGKGSPLVRTRGQQPFEGEGREKASAILTAEAASPGALVLRVTQEAAICKGGAQGMGCTRGSKGNAPTRDPGILARPQDCWEGSQTLSLL